MLVIASITQDGLARGVLVDLAGAGGRAGSRDLAALWQGTWGAVQRARGDSIITMLLWGFLIIHNYSKMGPKTLF